MEELGDEGGGWYERMEELGDEGGGWYEREFQEEAGEQSVKMCWTRGSNGRGAVDGENRFDVLGG